MWLVYIIKRDDGSLYTGITSNMERRLKEHQQKSLTKIKLLYSKPFPDQFQAAKREKQIKGWTQKKKLALIEGNLDLLKRL